MSIRAHTFKLIVNHDVKALASSAPVSKEIFAFAYQLVAKGESGAAVAVPVGLNGQAILKRVGETNEVRGITINTVADEGSSRALCDDLAFWSRSSFTLGRFIDAPLDPSEGSEARWSVGLPVLAPTRATMTDTRVPFVAPPSAQIAARQPEPTSLIKRVVQAESETASSSQQLFPQHMIRVCAFVMFGAMGFLAVVLAVRLGLNQGVST